MTGAVSRAEIPPNTHGNQWIASPCLTKWIFFDLPPLLDDESRKEHLAKKRFIPAVNVVCLWKSSARLLATCRALRELSSQVRYWVTIYSEHAKTAYPSAARLFRQPNIPNPLEEIDPTQAQLSEMATRLESYIPENPWWDWGPKFTLLGTAIKDRNLERVNELLMLGVDPNRPTQEGLKISPLSQAITKNSLEIVKRLLKEPAATIAPGDVQTAVLQAEDPDSNHSIWDTVLADSRCSHYDALFFAVPMGNQLLDPCDDHPNAPPKHQALARLLKLPSIDLNESIYGFANDTLLTWAVSVNSDATALLLSSRADVNKRSGQGMTPLHCAAWHGHVELVRVLLDAGADTTIQCVKGTSKLPNDEYFGKTPSEVARENGHADVAALIDVAQSGRTSGVASL
jgi:hypothetical protein